MASHLSKTASSHLTLWKYGPETMRFHTISDAAGAGSANRGGIQGAWLVVASDEELAKGEKARVSVLSWRSTRLKRVVASTLAGEVLSLSAALAEAE